MYCLNFKFIKCHLLLAFPSAFLSFFSPLHLSVLHINVFLPSPWEMQTVHVVCDKLHRNHLCVWGYLLNI